MYVKVTNGTVDQYPYTIGDLRRDNPSISFPKVVSDEMLAEYGVYPVTENEAPSFDEATENLVLNTQPNLIDGVWTVGFSSTPKTPEQIQYYNDDVIKGHRMRRDSALIMSDWTQMNDSPLSNEMKTAWATYRQELRDLTDLDAWPNLADEDWPVAP